MTNENLNNMLSADIAALEEQRDREIAAAIAADFEQNVAPQQAALEEKKEQELRRLAAEYEQRKAQAQAAYEATVATLVQSCEAEKKALADKSAQTIRYTAGVEYDSAINRIRELLK